MPGKGPADSTSSSQKCNQKGKLQVPLGSTLRNKYFHHKGHRRTSYCWNFKVHYNMNRVLSYLNYSVFRIISIMLQSLLCSEPSEYLPYLPFPSTSTFELSWLYFLCWNRQDYSNPKCLFKCSVPSSQLFFLMFGFWAPPGSTSDVALRYHPWQVWGRLWEVIKTNSLLTGLYHSDPQVFFFGYVLFSSCVFQTHCHLIPLLHMPEIHTNKN